jgi:hypothetical protein
MIVWQGCGQWRFRDTSSSINGGVMKYGMELVRSGEFVGAAAIILSKFENGDEGVNLMLTKYVSFHMRSMTRLPTSSSKHSKPCFFKPHHQTLVNCTRQPPSVYNEWSRGPLGGVGGRNRSSLVLDSGLD